MPRNLRPMGDAERAKNFGARQTWTGSDLNEVPVREDAYVDVLEATSTESAKYFLGHGANSRDDANAGYFYADLQTATPADIDGVFRFVVYEDSEDEVPVVGPSYTSADLREAAADARTERPVLPLLTPGAGKDKSIATQFKADAASDGSTISGADSNVNIPYTQHLQ